MVINFFGRRGSGKTTAIRGQLNDCRPPVIIIDILGNFNDPTFIQCLTLPDCLDAVRMYRESEPDERNFEGDSRQKIICLRTSAPTKAAEYLSASIWEIEGGTLILDEVDSIRIEEGSCFDEYIRYGRNHSGDLITGCRRPAEIDRNITAAGNKFYCFETHEYRDIEYFRQVFGDRAEELMQCPQYSGLYQDYDRKVIGKFHIDILGHIYHDEESALS
jgi:hypothetical protein